MLHSYGSYIVQMEALKKSLEDRERVLNNGITEMQNACRNLARKEEEVMIYAKKLEDQQRILEGVDSELLNKKVAIASAQRELNVMSMNNMWQNMHAKQQLKIDVNPPVPRKKEYVNCSATYPPQSVPKPTGRSPVSVSSPTNLSPAYTGASSHSNSHYGYNKPPDGQQIVIKDEIERARRVLDQSKNNHAQNSPYYQTVVQTQEFIHAETDFLNRIRKNSPISK